MNKERLLHLADLLEKNADNPTGVKFDLGLWGSSTGKPTVNCGTTACAVGIALLDPTFNQEGFIPKTIKVGDEQQDRYVMYPNYEDLTDWAAVCAFFGIRYATAVHLFVDGSYSVQDLPTQGAEAERAVAKRIRDVVAPTV